MAAYTRTSSDIVKNLMSTEPGQHDLFSAPECRQEKRRDRVRFRVIAHLYQQCKSRRLGVSLSECGYFRTHDPRQPLNFWHYEPQHSRDRAPSKVRSQRYNPHLPPALRSAPDATAADRLPELPEAARRRARRPAMRAKLRTPAKRRAAPRIDNGQGAVYTAT